MYSANDPSGELWPRPSSRRIRTQRYEPRGEDSLLLYEYPEIVYRTASAVERGRWYSLYRMDAKYVKE